MCCNAKNTNSLSISLRLFISKPKTGINFLTHVYICFRLEERQRAEKRNREANGHQFTPRWFNLTSEVTPTPWGELEVYQYNGKYIEHRAVADSSDSGEEINPTTTEFNPWQYDNLAAE